MTERPPTTHERANTELAQLLADPDFALKAATLFPLSVRGWTWVSPDHYCAAFEAKR